MSEYKYVRGQLVTSEMIQFARDLIWTGIPQGADPPKNDVIGNTVSWLEERVRYFQLLESRAAAEVEFVEAVDRHWVRGESLPGAVRKALAAGYKLEKL